MLVSRILVPFAAQASSRESTPEPHPYRRALEGTAASRGGPQGVAPPRPLLFARRPAIGKKVLPITGKLVVPRVIPNQVTRSGRESGVTDLATGGTGISGGLPGGQPGDASS